jgi:hypothetical protein
VESTICKNVEPALRDRPSAIKGQPLFDDETSPQSNSRSAASIGNPQSAIENSRQRPYVKTPARMAAARANLEKARAAPKEKVYRRTEKRLAANRANLAKTKTARRKELEAIVSRLDTVFPPLGEEIPEEAVEAEFICPCGSGKTFHQCCKGRKPKIRVPGPYSPGDRQSGVEEEADVPQVPLTIFRFGSPKWCNEGVDPQAPDYGALEKAGRAIVHRQRALLNEVRREGREVMRLLTQAAQRTVAPTLQDILALAGSLMAALGESRLACRAQRLNRRVAKLLEAFVEKRYERAGVVVSTETLFKRLMAPVEGSPPLPQRPKRRRPRSAPTPGACAPEPASGAGAPCASEPALRSRAPSGGAFSGASAARPNPQRKAAEVARPDPGSDLPESQDEFVRLVSRAFCAPHSEPEDEGVRRLIDDLAGSLWHRLHKFSADVQWETAKLNQVLDQMGDTAPDEGPNHVSTRCRLIEAELQQTARSAETIITISTELLSQQLETLMLCGYGPDPDIERVCSARYELRTGCHSGFF